MQPPGSSHFSGGSVTGAGAAVVEDVGACDRQGGLSHLDAWTVAVSGAGPTQPSGWSHAAAVAAGDGATQPLGSSHAAAVAAASGAGVFAAGFCELHAASTITTQLKWRISSRISRAIHFALDEDFRALELVSEKRREMFCESA